jgi:hypothetical protein
MDKEFSTLWSLLNREDCIGKYVGIIDGGSTATDIETVALVDFMWSTLHVDTVNGVISVGFSTVQDCNIEIASKSFKRFQISDALEI